MNKSRKNIDQDIEKLAIRIGDRDIASEIIYIYYDNNINKSVLMSRYKNIVTLCTSLGFRLPEIHEYIKRNKKILRLDTNVLFENYNMISSIFIKNKGTKTELREYIKSSFNGKNILLTEQGNMIRVFNLISRIFKSKAKSEEELYKYLYDNRNILMEKSDGLVAKLSILSKVGLDDALIFDEPMYIYSDVNAEAINNAIECLKSKNEKLTLNKIFSYAYGVIDNEDDIKYNLDDKELSKTSYDYHSKLARNIK